MAVGDTAYGKLDVSEWDDIVAVAAGGEHTVGVKADGTAVAVGKNTAGQSALAGLVDNVAVAAGVNHTVLLKSDGYARARGSDTWGQTEPIGDWLVWESLVAVAAGDDHSIGLKEDGTVLAVGRNVEGQCNVSGWTDIVAVAAGTYHTVGLKADGRVVTVGGNDGGERDVSTWRDIVEVSASRRQTIGLKSDGSVVGTGRNDYGQLNVGDWSLIAPLNESPIQGGSRYETAVQASKKAFPAGGSTYVVIATGANWPDALGGSALAGVLEAPILLTKRDVLPPEVSAEVTRLRATKAVILGGATAVSSAVEASLVSKLGAANVERIAGGSRYETAEKVAARTISEQSFRYSGSAFVTTGKNFPDALGASPIAAAKGWPIYLVDPTKGDNTALVATMSAAGVKKPLILGGTGVVSPGVATALESLPLSPYRIAGSSRYDTALAAARYGVRYAGLSWDKVALATGAKFPDALAGGVLQGLDGSVMLLTPSSSLDANVGAALAGNASSIFEVRYLGGEGALSPVVRVRVAQVLK